MLCLQSLEIIKTFRELTCHCALIAKLEFSNHNSSFLLPERNVAIWALEHIFEWNSKLEFPYLNSSFGLLTCKINFSLKLQNWSFQSKLESLKTLKWTKLLAWPKLEFPKPNSSFHSSMKTLRNLCQVKTGVFKNWVKLENSLPSVNSSFQTKTRVFSKFWKT